MRKSSTILAALAVAIGGAALTGTGVTNNAGAAQFVGGTVSQSVTGAETCPTWLHRLRRPRQHGHPCGQADIREFRRGR